MEEHTFPKEKRRSACPGYSQFWFFSRDFFLPCFTGNPDIMTEVNFSELTENTSTKEDHIKNSYMGASRQKQEV